MRGAVRWLDARFGLARLLHGQLKKAFPAHWSFLLGEIALFSFIVLVFTGIYLTLFYEASGEMIVYDGVYEPLVGTSMSRAYASVIELSFRDHLGLLVRQTHHWAALVFVAAIVLHLARVFFTGAFRNPREINWMVGVTMLLLAVVNGYFGYSLVDDVLAGMGGHIVNSGLLSIPVVGPWLASALFGGEFPSLATIPRFFVFHVLIIPVTLGVLIAVHLAIVWKQKHTQFPERGVSESTLYGPKLWPSYAARSMALFFFVSATLVALGGLIQIHAVWMTGPFLPGLVSSPLHPDWYLGWIEGANRILPPLDFTLFGYLVPSLFFSSVLLPGVTLLLLYAWPFIEARFTGDYDTHHVLDRPSERPVRTAIGAAALTFYTLLFVAASADVVSVATAIDVQTVMQAFRFIVVLGPVAAGATTYLILSGDKEAQPT